MLEEYNDAVEHRGMQFQAFEVEHLVRTGTLSAILPPEESVRIMETLDTIRRQISLTYPGEKSE